MAFTLREYSFSSSHSNSLSYNHTYVHYTLSSSYRNTKLTKTLEAAILHMNFDLVQTD